MINTLEEFKKQQRQRKEVNRTYLKTMRLFYETTKEYKTAQQLHNTPTDKLHLSSDRLSWLNKRCNEKKGHYQMIKRSNPKYFITITTPLNITDKQLHYKTSELLQRVNKSLFGRNYYKYKDTQLNGFVFFENGHGNKRSHYHLLACDIGINTYNDIGSGFKKACSKIKLYGRQMFNYYDGIDIQEIYDIEGIADYCIKEMDNASDFYLLNERGIA